jgi:hypothetical protein
MLGSDVFRIGYSFADEWTGEPSLFFRVLLWDAPSEYRKLGELTERIRRGIGKEVKPDELGLHAFFNFRTKTEQDDLQDPAWVKECHSRKTCSSRRSTLRIASAEGRGRRASGGQFRPHTMPHPKDRERCVTVS